MDRRAEPAQRRSRNRADHRSPEDAVTSVGRLAFFCSQDALRLAARVFDAESAERLPLLCLPGLSRNSRDFIPLGAYFSRHPTAPRKVLALDYRGRGRSDRDPNWRNYTPLVEAQDVLAAGAALGIERAIVVGTSRGGILAMLLGAMRPGLLAGLVLNDIGPVIEGAGLARIRQYLGQRRAVRDWDEAVAAVKAVAARQFPALEEADWRAYAEATFASAQSGLVPDFDPILVRAIQDVDFSTRLPDLWPQFLSLTKIPVLAVRGETSDILSARTLAEMSERHPKLQQLTVPGQGHAPLLSDPPTLERIDDFAGSCDNEVTP